MFYFETNELGFSPEFMGRVRLVAALASLAGVAVYNTWLKDVPLRRMFLWTAVLGTGLGLTQLILITGTVPPTCPSSHWRETRALHAVQTALRSRRWRVADMHAIIQPAEGHVCNVVH